MAAVAEIRYYALKPLTLQDTEGGRLTVQAGEEIPAVLHGPWLIGSIDAGKVAEFVAGESLETVDDDDFKAEASRRGYRLVKKA